jgi:glutamyl-tRNA reductase
MLSLVLVGMSFRTASLEQREQVSKVFQEPHFFHSSSIKESTPLVTCNRVEVYLAAENADSAIESTLNEIQRRSRVAKKDIYYVKRDYDAVVHLFRASCGLDSLVVGEEQILQQIKEASRVARVSGEAKSTLSSLFDAAVSVGRRVRENCDISSLDRSVSALALKFGVEKLGREPKSVLLVGTGKTARLALNELKDAKIFVLSQRKDIPKFFPGSTFVPYADLKDVMARCELVISATKSPAGYIIKTEHVGEDKPLVMLDLAFPRNIDPAIKNSKTTQLYDLNDLGQYIEQSAQIPKFETEAESLIGKEAEQFIQWLTASKLSPTLSNIYQWAEEMRVYETENTLRRLPSIRANERWVVEAMGKRLVSKLLAGPAAFAKQSVGDLTQDERLRLLDELYGPVTRKLSQQINGTQHQGRN